MDGLTKYRVSYKEAECETLVQFFDCWAEDYQHAYDQAENAYPDAELLNATPIEA